MTDRQITAARSHPRLFDLNAAKRVEGREDELEPGRIGTVWLEADQPRACDRKIGKPATLACSAIRPGKYADAVRPNATQSVTLHVPSVTCDWGPIGTCSLPRRDQSCAVGCLRSGAMFVSTERGG